MDSAILLSRSTAIEYASEISNEVISPLDQGYRIYSLERYCARHRQISLRQGETFFFLPDYKATALARGTEFDQGESAPSNMVK